MVAIEFCIWYNGANEGKVIGMAEGLEFFWELTDAAWFAEKFLTALGWVVLCHGVCIRRERLGRFLAELFALTGAFIAASAGVIIFPPTEYLWWMTRVVGAAVPVGYLYFRSPYSRKTTLLLWCSMFAGVCALSAIGGQLSMLLGAMGLKGTPEALIRMAFDLMLLPLGLYLRRFNFDEYDILPNSGMMVIIAGDVSILLLYVVEYFLAQEDYPVMVTLAVGYTCMLTMVLFAVHAMHAICKEQTEIISLQAEHQRLLAEQETLRLADSNLEDLRCIRHDLRNQYAYMQILLEEQRYEELGAYFHQVARNLPTPLKLVDCGNQVMNTILNVEFGKARQEQIEVVHQLVIPPRLPFAEKDLCAIVANLMDNAIEECRRIRTEGQEKTVIYLDIYPQKSYLFLQCRNLTTRQSLKRMGWGLQSTKGDEKLHGYGTKIVARTAEKYNGMAEFSIKDGFFVAKVLLDMMEGTQYANQNGTV